jgi:Protein of unknown function (DUF4232)
MTLRGVRPMPSARFTSGALPRAVVLTARALTAGALVTATLAACGSEHPGPPGGVTACPSSALRVALDTSAETLAAGSSYLPLDFTNTAHSACRLTGYPDVAFAAGAPGARIGGSAARDQGVAARAVTLAPGATAHAWLVVAAAANYPAGQCHPVTAHALQVRAPGQDGVSYLRHEFPACAAAALSGGSVLTVQPVQPGRAKRGTAQ